MKVIARCLGVAVVAASGAFVVGASPGGAGLSSCGPNYDGVCPTTTTSSTTLPPVTITTDPAPNDPVDPVESGVAGVTVTRPISAVPRVTG